MKNTLMTSDQNYKIMLTFFTKNFKHGKSFLQIKLLRKWWWNLICSIEKSIRNALPDFKIIFRCNVIQYLALRRSDVKMTRSNFFDELTNRAIVKKNSSSCHDKKNKRYTHVLLAIGKSKKQLEMSNDIRAHDWPYINSATGVTNYMYIRHLNVERISVSISRCLKI